jgi:hypothetical protein
MDIPVSIPDKFLQGEGLTALDIKMCMTSMIWDWRLVSIARL